MFAPWHNNGNDGIIGCAFDRLVGTELKGGLLGKRITTHHGLQFLQGIVSIIVGVVAMARADRSSDRTILDYAASFWKLGDGYIGRGAHWYIKKV
eukprot:scaffold296594_cov70-Attheya_sp.AAC.2